MYVGRAEEDKDENKEDSADKVPFKLVTQTLFENRYITIFGEINQDVARATTEKLMALSLIDQEAPIVLLIGSPGGHVESGDSIFDMIRAIKPIVYILGTGWVGSIATHIYLSIPVERRYALPNTRFLIHQPSGGFGGDASDIEIQADEIIKTRERINTIIAEQTGQTVEKIDADTERDCWLSVEESIAYGLVGKQIQYLSELPVTSTDSGKT